MKEMTTKVKLIIGGLVVIIIALMFGGSKSPDSTTPAPVNSPVITESPDKVPSMTAEDEFLYAIMMSDEDFYMTYDDTDLIDLGWVICESLDAGISFDDIILTAVDSGIDAHGIGTVIGAAVSNLCMQHYDSAVAWLNQYGY